MIFIDTHLHLDERIMDSINKLSPNYGIIIGTDKQSNEEAIKFCMGKNNFFYTLGIHPSEASNYSNSDLEFILDNVSTSVAIGEIGLDYYWKNDNKEEQKELFEKQIKIAINNNKPIVIHNREATDDIYNILKKYDERLKIIFHCFTYGKHELELLLNLNCKFGIGGPITYPKNEDLREAVKLLPIDRILLETDSPYLSPQEKRKELNTPLNIPLIARKIAEIKEITEEEVITKTTLNAIAWFDLKV